MSFVSGSGMTPFGYFDSDPQFQVDADKVLDFVYRKLGDPVMNVELNRNNVYASFEEACLEFSAVVNSYQAKSVLATVLGSPTGSLSGKENKYPQRTLEMLKRMAEPFGTEAGVNGQLELRSGSVSTQPGVATYDLGPHAGGALSGSSPTGSDGRPLRVYIREIFHPDPVSAYRFFGTTSAVNYLNNQFSFESFTPETVFYLLPIWEDVLRGMQFKLSNKVRRSNYSYEIHNNKLTLYPTPSAAVPLYFKYTVAPDPYSPDADDPSLSGVANLSNVPFGNIAYSSVNSIGRQWIRKFTVALAKEALGLIRGKFQSIPIPNGDVTMNGAELITDSRAEQDTLRTELKEILEDTTYDKLAAREAEMAASLQAAVKEVPLGIYVG